MIKIILLQIYFLLIISLFQVNDTTAQKCERGGIATGWIINYSDTDLDKYTTECAATNAAYFRVDLPWGIVQQGGATSWDWTKTDRIVNSALSKGLKIVALLANGFPSWANEDTDTAYWYKFVYEMGKRYIPMGITEYEVWNEANIINFWPKPNVAKYTNNILKPGSNAIRKAARELDKTVTVITVGLSPAYTDGSNISQLDFVKGIYLNGGKNYFDAVGQHPYCKGADPLIKTDWNWFLKTEELYDVMVANGDGNKKIWATEFGFSTSSSTNGVSLTKQAEYMQKVYTKWNSWSWTGPLIWYSYRNVGTDSIEGEDNFGMVFFDWSPKPALQVFKNIMSNCNATNVNSDFYTNNDIYIYPNPVHDILLISNIAKDSKISLFDIKGTLLIQESVINDKTELDVSKLFAGVYFIKFSNSENVLTRMFIKK